ncbi:MAG TPA: hypothetical protein VLF91_02215 [Candidatus Saccharimonadales bacterium]|nr:hypothetical protein [Candidatus Saccharimonadales bacterium]
MARTIRRRKKVDILDLPMVLVTWAYLRLLGVTALGYVLLHWLWGKDMFLSIHDLLGSPSGVQPGLLWAWPIFAWALGLTILATWAKGGDNGGHGGMETLVKGWWVSLNAGFFEEVTFRLLSFLTAMVMLRFFNYITFGFVHLFYRYVLLPPANFMTFGLLHQQLYSPMSWLVGAALLSAAAKFRNGHSYQGTFGLINSWYLGMVFFYVMFHYGILAAIIAHALYDGIIFTVESIGAAIDDRRQPVFIGRSW